MTLRPAPISPLRRRGFNLLEIAIVLAVIGLVIGGIYVAAAAVSENNRQQLVIRQVLQISANVRSLYATQSTFVELNFDQMKALGIIPGDLQAVNGNFFSAYGDRIHLADAASTGYSNQTFYISYYSIPKSACIAILVKTFGNPQTYGNAGVVAVGTWPNHFIGGAQLADGVSIAEADSVCDNTSPNSIVPGTNEICFIFNLH